MLNSLIPELLVSHYDKSLIFYTEILGFKLDYDRPEDKFAMLSLEGSQLMINQRNGWWETGPLEFPFGRGINIQIRFSHVDKLIESLKKNSISLYQDVEEIWRRKDDEEIGSKEFLVQDPDGYLLRFTQNVGMRKIT